MFKKISEYKVRDWVVIAMISAILGVVFTLLDSAYSPLSNLLGPTFISLTFGLYALSALLPAYIIRKPGAAVVGALIAAVINILTGSPYGIHIIVAGLLQGLGTEVGFAIRKYEKYNFISFAFTAVFITIFVSARDYLIFSLSQLTVPLLIVTLVIRCVSAWIISYVICYLVGKALEKTGLVKFGK
ncbi:MAG: ECF transporter S component [Suipraeoptans sp.]